MHGQILVNYSRARVWKRLRSKTLLRLSSTVTFVGGGIVTANLDRRKCWPRRRCLPSLTRDTLMNEFILDSGTASLTDWVITFPTKRYYTLIPVAANQPFSNAFSNSLAPAIRMG